MITSAKLLFFCGLSSPQAENLPIFNVLKGITRFQRGENKGRELCADILGLDSRSLFLHIIIYYRPSVVAVFLLLHKNTRQLEIQRLPGMNAAKIGIISESCKYFAIFFVLMCPCVAFYFDFEDLGTKST